MHATMKAVMTIAAFAMVMTGALTLATAPASADEKKGPPERSITDLGNNIYRFQNDAHYSVFIVGASGLVLTDPIDADAARWLRAEIKKRFGDLPVRYVIYSHNHPDHVSGGEVFAGPETTIIAHEKAAEDLARNNVATAAPNVTFNDKLTFTFEGRRMELAYWGRNNGAGSISLYVPDAKCLFAVDWVLLKRLPWREMYHYDLDGMIASLEKLLREVDFELVSPGHSVTGNKADLREFLSYLKDLRSGVLAAMNEGKTLEQTLAELTLSKYKHFAKYEEWRKGNIKGAWAQLAQTSGRFGQDR